MSNEIKVKLGVDTKEVDRVAIGVRLYDMLDGSNDNNRLHRKGGDWFIDEDTAQEMIELVNPMIKVINEKKSEGETITCPKGTIVIPRLPKGATFISLHNANCKKYKLTYETLWFQDEFIKTKIEEIIKTYVGIEDKSSVVCSYSIIGDSSLYIEIISPVRYRAEKICMELQKVYLPRTQLIEEVK